MQDPSLRSSDVAAFRDGCVLAGYDADAMQVWAEREPTATNAASSAGAATLTAAGSCVIHIVYGEFAMSFLARAGTDWTSHALRAVWEGRCGPRVRRIARPRA